MPYAAPKDLLTVLANVEFETALAADYPRFIDTTAARGSEQTLARLAKKLGLDLRSGDFDFNNRKTDRAP